MSGKRVVVVGGGISGLSTAWFLHQAGFSVQVLESRERVGGSILTSRIAASEGSNESYLIEHGPNSTLQKPGNAEDALGRLIDAMGLESQLLEANPLAARRFIYKGGKLQALPTSPPAFIKTPVFSLMAKLRLLLEPFIGRAEQEESIAEFVTRRLGKEFLDYAIEPFISGVYAGDPKKLSVRAAVAKIYALEKEHGSLIRGAMAMGKVHKASGMPKGRMISFTEGMEMLPRTVAEKLPANTVQTSTKVKGISQDQGVWTILWQRGEEHHSSEADYLVLSTPAQVTAQLVRPLSTEAAGLLEGIQYAPIESVALGYPREDVAHPLDGFGFLIPRREGVKTLGGLFSSTLFPGRSPEGKVLLTCFIGGTTNPAMADADDQAVVTQVDRDMVDCLGIQKGAEFVHLTRYKAAIAQYELGHLDRVAGVDRALEGYKGLYLRANWRDGVSVADCVRNGEKTAQTIFL
uniref:Putative protoporphyrinogen oxidase n=1 Tax=Magnetococcus massalia (strain MO-1) TaxID=451514 RepID=A0A1S7LNB8_MAGMO|nr:putative protoporphyrinogen oxidase [Candidatus Magnetococcus massalia]